MSGPAGDHPDVPLCQRHGLKQGRNPGAFSPSLLGIRLDFFLLVVLGIFFPGFSFSPVVNYFVLCFFSFGEYGLGPAPFPFAKFLC